MDVNGPDTWIFRLKKTAKNPIWIISFTWGIANTLKPFNDKERRAFIIKALNWTYFILSIFVLLLTIILSCNDLSSIQPSEYCCWTIFIQYIIIGRFFEISLSFINDASDKLKREKSSSSLTWADRLWLALRSYAELISNFVIIYTLFPASAWTETEAPPPPSAITDLIWYSVNTITTSGGGGYYPSDIFLKISALFELFGGLILVIMSFAIYTNLALSEKSTPGTANSIDSKVD